MNTASIAIADPTPFNGWRCPGKKSDAFFGALVAEVAPAVHDGDLSAGVAVVPSDSSLLANTDLWEALLQGTFSMSDGAAATHREITSDEAAAIVGAILHKSQAYGSVILGKDRAEAWAVAFCVSMDGATFFTNTSADGGGRSATNATFDTGVLAVIADRGGGEGVAACVWLRDED